MGISAIFKRSKVVESSDSFVEVPKARHIKRRQTEPSYSSSKPSAIGRSRSSGSHAIRSVKDAEAESRGTALTQRGTSKYTKSADVSTELSIDELPTPDDSLDEGSTRRHLRDKILAPKEQTTVPATSHNARPSDKRPAQANNDVFGMRNLKALQQETWAARHKELDPFEDSPPRRPLTDFEDPTYIPPLTLAATLFDDYSYMGSLGGTTGAAGGNGHYHPSAAGGDSTTTKDLGSGTLDFLGDFNATYSALFGTPPSTTLAASDRLRSPDNTQQSNTHSDGLLSPASTRQSKTPSPVGEMASDDERSELSAESGSTGGSSSGEPPELVEERRKEEERKAAEQRSRRREVIKQQVAFERMKERHRRQRPEPTSAPFGRIARWQSEAAVAATVDHPQPAQGTLYASSTAISRGYVPQQPRTGTLGAAQYASASMPSIARDVNTPLVQRQPHFPLLVDTATARETAVLGPQMSSMLASPLTAPALHTNRGFHSAPAVSGAHTSISGTTPPQPRAAHPVRLASMPQSTKNAYLSDSSGDNVSDVSSLGGSDDTSGSSSVDAFYSAASSAATASIAEARVAPVFTGSTVGSTPLPSALQRTSSGNDSSSEGSAMSQSSSKRRVRFQETVSVVFNTHHSIAEDDHNCLNDSDNDSSNASINMSVAPHSINAPDTDRCSPICANDPAPGASAADDAFDDAGAIGHSRYRIPASVAVQVGPLLWPEAGVIADSASPSRQTSGASSRNDSPDEAKRRCQRPKHRVETQPLRDREAERELQLRKKLAAANREPVVKPVGPEPSVDGVAVTQSASEPHVQAETAEEAQSADPMTEARRALLGHYYAPNPMLPVGNTIPRSTPIVRSNSMALPHTSGVKVVCSQSSACSQNRYSAGAGAIQSRSDSWRGLRGPRRGHSVTSTRRGQSNAGQSKVNHTTEHTPVVPAAKDSHTYSVALAASTKEIARRDSHEFNFTNVLESFSASSFELFEGKEGGVHIRYSDRKGAHHKPSSVSSQFQTDNAADNSDGDDIPLSVIVRSRSEPLQNHFRRSETKPLAANTGALGHAVDTCQDMSHGRMLVRSTGSLKNRSVDSRQVYADTCSASVEANHQQTSDASSRRFSRWGNIF
ncbi:hypothetical protein COEREDRAFT_93587 [Coemansia reversa NRRL 1564]|uniref:Uncharacterized protein n=1 Tax=Coemansia reversa (strain ATCC 12441 / NRRL 1564) TaxID=763665 RepID=A0A2G5B896_COERN|nr:hypothetical protein COEREDRAFT_93587 [Coemansia reversa NRRL 1564]|eukprot:PIA14947.1 hypothetical protein COEREDRAFT_93587 [Coemansia reversa NRRL 1564]